MQNVASVDANDLPPRLAALAALIGLPKTLHLVEARGGTRIYVPDVASMDHWLVRLIAQASARHARMIQLHTYRVTRRPGA